MYKLNKIGLILIFLEVFFVTNTSAQQENVWVFGNLAGINFNSSVPAPVSSAMHGFGEANASVCDSTGQLLFYTEGSYVWARNNTLMPNGSDLTLLSDTGTISPTTSTTQGAVIVPMPDSNGKYYIFSLTEIEAGTNAGKLYYSVVDMSLNGGLGDIVPGRKGILLDSGLTERMTAIVGDRCNVWLLTVSTTTQLKAYDITSSGIDLNPVISGLGLDHMVADSIGCIIVSPDRKRITMTKILNTTTASEGATVSNFDAASGVLLSTSFFLPYPDGYFACFSPDNTKLYITSGDSEPSDIYQYDLSLATSTAVAGSQTLIGAAGFTQLKLTPDGKIYFSTEYYNNLIGVIDSPNLLGAACHYAPYMLSLSGTMYGGFPSAVPVFRRDTIYSMNRDTANCFADTLLLHILDSSGTDYVWSDGNTSAQETVDSDGKYWVTYHTPPCVFNVDTFKVIFPKVKAAFTYGFIPACKQDTVKLSDESAGTTYQIWEFGDGSISDTGKDIAHVYLLGNYEVTLVTGNHICTDSATETIKVSNDSVKLTNVTPDQTIAYGSSLQLNADGTLYYLWLPNNGTLDNPDINNPVATPLDSTTYVVIGMDSIGCRDTAVVHIGVDYNMKIFIPNAFTPNGDGKDDVFRIVNMTYQKLLEMRVFNRWGQEIFYSANPNTGWDGTYNGVPQAIGTYNYLIVIARPDGINQLYKGDVILIR